VSASPRWAAVVVNYESGPLLEQCVRSVVADDSAGPAELVVVDNASQDDSVATLRATLPDVTVIRAPGNLGYARAANLGTAATRADVVAVLNPDTRLEPGTAAACLGRLERAPHLGACGPRLKNLDGTDYPSARRNPSLPLAVMHALLGLWWPTNRFTARYRQLDADPARARDVDWVSGAAVWLRRASLDAVGGWDERYFMYFEEVDLCWRLRSAGWEIAYEPGGVVWHVHGAMTSRHPYRMCLEHHRSAWRYARRRMTGVRSLLLPFAAAFLTVRGGLAMAAHASRARRARPRKSDMQRLP
jgi:N-acetylglucosaminyl-diphospho-decaprenol L-rhamnosyltransferase